MKVKRHRQSELLWVWLNDRRMFPCNTFEWVFEMFRWMWKWCRWTSAWTVWQKSVRDGQSPCQSLSIAPPPHISPSSPFPSIVRQSVAAIPSPPELRPFFPGLWLAWRYSCVLAWPACLYTGGEGRDWLSQAQSHTLTHPLNKATQQDCFSSLLVGQSFPAMQCRICMSTGYSLFFVLVLLWEAILNRQ